MFLSVITVGYAVLSAAFNISGIAKISNSTWSVYFDNLEINSDSVPIKSGGRTPTIPAGSKDTTTLEWDINLSKPGQFYEFTVDVFNEGSIDASIDTVVVNTNLTEDEEKLIDFKVVYMSNERTPKKKDALHSGERQKLRVRVEFKKDIDALDLEFISDGGIDKTMSIQINYIQADGTENEIEIGAYTLIARANPLSVTNYTSGNTSEMYTFQQRPTIQVASTIDYRFIGDTNCSYDNGVYWFAQRDGGTCSNIYKKNDSGTITYEDSCVEENGITCEELTGELRELHNYIKFNGNEMWRIIGVFDGRIKIMKGMDRSNRIKSAKDNKIDVGTGDGLIGGSNDWSDAQLMFFLNGEESPLRDGYTKENGYVYDNNHNMIYKFGYYPCSTASGGLLAGADYCLDRVQDWRIREEDMAKLDKVMYYTSLNRHYTSARDAYVYERADYAFYPNRAINWTGKVALMYSSDYLYTYGLGVDIDGKCVNDGSTCGESVGKANSWLYEGVYEWTLDPLINHARNSVLIYQDGSISAEWFSSNTGDIRPVGYLKKGTTLKGSGTKDDPYEIFE